MKLPFIIILFFIFCFSKVYSQSDVIDATKNAINAGSTKELIRYFGNNLLITLDGEAKSYSKAQAEYVFKDFFKNNPPKNYSIIHQGSSKSGLPYVIGKYTSNKKTYRVWMRLKSIKSANYFIQEISFIEE